MTASPEPLSYHASFEVCRHVVVSERKRARRPSSEGGLAQDAHGASRDDCGEHVCHTPPHARAQVDRELGFGLFDLENDAVASNKEDRVGYPENQARAKAPNVTRVTPGMAQAMRRPRSETFDTFFLWHRKRASLFSRTTRLTYSENGNKARLESE